MATNESLQSRPRVLIVRPSALGDVSRTVTALVTLRRAMPDAQIDWLVNDTFADAVRHHPDLDNVVTFGRSRFAATFYRPRVARDLIHWARDLRSRRYDIVIDLQGLARSGLLSWITGAAQRIGFANAREFAHLAYNRKHTIDPGLHTVDRMLSLLKSEGYATHLEMRLHVGDQDRQWRDRLLGDVPYICLAPTARWRCKCWPIDRYIQLAQHLLRDRLAGDRIVILAAPAERPQVQPLLAALRPTRRVLLPTTTVGQMMALLSRTRLLVCNDSAPLHIAVAFNRPIAAIFGPTDPALIGPYQRDDAVLRPRQVDAKINYRRRKNDQTLIAQIGVDAVYERVVDQLRNSQSTTGSP